jgi:hypothetical protein
MCTNQNYRRTYGPKEGEEIREGFEPTDSPPIIDPKVEDNASSSKTPQRDESPGKSPFALGEDETPSPGAEESEIWKKDEDHSPPLLKPKYGFPGEDMENVWSQGEPKGEARENP